MHNDIKDFVFPVMLPLIDMKDDYNLGGKYSTNPSKVERIHYELVDFN